MARDRVPKAVAGDTGKVALYDVNGICIRSNIS